jgi:Ca2+-binding EF-hand superfamily protein
MTSSIDEYLEGELREAFQQFDRDGNGTIDRAEFAELLDALDAQMNDEEADVGFREIDSNHNGKIEFEEFLAWWQDR